MLAISVLASAFEVLHLSYFYTDKNMTSWAQVSTDTVLKHG